MTMEADCKLSSKDILQNGVTKVPTVTEQCNGNSMMRSSSALTHQPDQGNENTESTCCGKDPPEKCGCCTFYPKSLQKFAHPIAYLACISLLVLVHSLLAAGYVSSILTTIEKRYELTGTELGIIVSSYDLTSMIVGVIISYGGERYNRAKVLSRCGMVLALGSTIFCLPYFIGETYTIPSNGTDTLPVICNVTDLEPQKSSPEECDFEKPDTWALAIFIIAQLIMGAGASAIFTLGPTYLYDNVQPDRYGLYVGK